MRSRDRDAKGLGRVVRGKVSASGGIIAGTGFSAAKNATGDYTVTFIPPFRAPPVVTFGQYSSFPLLLPEFQSEPTASSMRVYLNNNTGTSADSGFHFTAMEAIPA